MTAVGLDQQGAAGANNWRLPAALAGMQSRLTLDITVLIVALPKNAARPSPLAREPG